MAANMLQFQLVNSLRPSDACMRCKVTIIGSDNGLLPEQHQAVIWTNVGILLAEPLGTNFSEILIQIHTFSFKTTYLKMPSGKWRPFCLSLNVVAMQTSDRWYKFVPVVGYIKYITWWETYRLYHIIEAWEVWSTYCCDSRFNSNIYTHCWCFVGLVCILIQYDCTNLHSHLAAKASWCFTLANKFNIWQQIYKLMSCREISVHY